eukprot:5581325-Prymnesium_polylepis.1
MGALDSFFYGFGYKVAAGLMRWFRPGASETSEDAAVLLLDLHTVTSDMMAGLGNTFSGTLLLVSVVLSVAQHDPPTRARRSPRSRTRHRRPRNRQSWTQ